MFEKFWANEGDYYTSIVRLRGLMRNLLYVAFGVADRRYANAPRLVIAIQYFQSWTSTVLVSIPNRD